MLLIKNIGTLQTPVGSCKHGGGKQGENIKLHDAAILIEDGIIKAITQGGILPEGCENAEVIDAGGALVTPGLIDCHTHMVFGGYRQGEIPLKLRGATYLDILRAGGGILDTVGKTRAATEDELYEKTKAFLDEMLTLGVTTAESKSGYGLDLENELKQLRVNKRLQADHKMDLVSTFLGAHAIPEEYKGRADEYIDLLCDVVLPAVKEEGLADFVDVFCEDSVFDVTQSEKMLKAGQALGLRARIHADEIEEIGGAVLSGELGAISAEHLIATGEKGMASMAKGGVIADLLPCTSLYLNKTFAPARRMIELGIPVAIASDFNPGSCPSLNLQLAMSMGYVKYHMTPEEILTAVTINAACSCGLEEKVGTLEVGKQADIVIWNAPDMEMLVYRFGSNLAKTVIKRGEVV
ncbi:MAG: imidazolonepropionase [Ruminococcaceae bacterium]|nr:imidazolonepropionase [Oscillospiraceae bacterium]